MKIQNAFRLGLFGGLGVLVAVAIGGGFTILGPIITYVGAALFLALGIDPAVSWLERRKLPRWLAILIVLVGILAVFAGLVLAIIPVIADQVGNLIAAGARHHRRGRQRRGRRELVARTTSPGSPTTTS